MTDIYPFGLYRYKVVWASPNQDRRLSEVFYFGYSFSRSHLNRGKKVGLFLG